MNSIRRENIRRFVEANHIVTLPQLSELCPDVSLMTIHRDLSWLQDQGVLVKIRGGARYIADISNEPAFAAREMINKDAKNIIAGKAVSLLRGSSSIFVDAGTTMMAFAKSFPDVQINVVTTGPNISMELAKRSLLNISLCGGSLNKNNLTLSGDAAFENLRNINIDTAFVAASGYNGRSGFTCGMESEAHIKKYVIEKARTSVILIDHSKFEKVMPYTFAYLKDFDYMITDVDPKDLPGEILSEAQAQGLCIK